MIISQRTLLFFLFTSLIFTACSKDDDVDPVTPTAEAGNPQTIQLPVNTVTLTGSGTTQNGSIAGYLWSLVSGPNVPVIQSPSSASTVVNGMIAGRYVFQLMVIDNAGLTGVDTTSVQVNAAVQQTITLQPANNTANEINFAGNSTQNLSAHDIDLDAAAWTINSNNIYIRGAFKFDLSGIPANATIISAKLNLYSNPTPINGDLANANSGTNNSMFIRRITASWSGTTATWQSQPGTTTTDQLVIPHTNLSTLDLVDMDVTTLVNTMRTSGNYGFMMMLQNEAVYNIRQFCSSNHSNAAKRPKLVIIYQ
jgi:hypothetical protein